MTRRPAWWRFGLDPWYTRARDRIDDWWQCHIRRRHHVKLGSHGRCYRCGKVQPAEWVRSPFPGGGTYVDLTRLTDGRVMCQLCFGYFHVNELHELEPGVVEDVCKPCVALETRLMHEKLLKGDQ